MSAGVKIHSTAIVHAGARVDPTAEIGPYCIAGAEVEIGAGCRLVSHVVLDGHTRLAEGVQIYSFAAVGIAPQDLKYKNEPTAVEIGARTVIRESVTISRGTAGGGGTTRVGKDCLIMAYAHIGHDSQIGDHCILANAATLAGHVIVEEYATVGALCPVHQFCRIGRHAYVGGGTTITQDVLPYSLTSAKRETHAYGLNKVGLERRGFTPVQMKELHAAYRTLLASKKNTAQALEALREQCSSGAAGEHVAYLVQFIASAERGVIK